DRRRARVGGQHHLRRVRAVLCGQHHTHLAHQHAHAARVREHCRTRRDPAVGHAVGPNRPSPGLHLRRAWLRRADLADAVGHRPGRCDPDIRVRPAAVGRRLQRVQRHLAVAVRRDVRHARAPLRHGHRHADRLRARRFRAHDQRGDPEGRAERLGAGGRAGEPVVHRGGHLGVHRTRNLQRADAPTGQPGGARLSNSSRVVEGASMPTGKTTLIAHLGYPTETFKAPMIYNPWFERRGIDAIVVPMGVKAQDYAVALDALSRFTNLRGALVTMPHKNATLALVAQATSAARIAGACNALLRLPDGTWLGDQFDGAGFVHGVQRKGRSIEGARVLIAGSGGVGSAIAASIAQAGAAQINLFDANAAEAAALRDRLLARYPRLDVRTGSNDPAGYDMVVNATPLGMKDDDPLPFDVERIAPGASVGEVVMKSDYTLLLPDAEARGCPVQVGTDMLFEMIQACLEFF